MFDPMEDRRKRLYEQMQGSINPSPIAGNPQIPNIPETPQMQPIKWMDMNPPAPQPEQGSGIGGAIGQLGSALLTRKKKGGSLIGGDEELSI